MSQMQTETFFLLSFISKADVLLKQEAHQLMDVNKLVAYRTRIILSQVQSTVIIFCHMLKLDN